MSNHKINKNKFINLIDIRLNKLSNKKNYDKHTNIYINELFITAFQLIKNGFTKKSVYVQCKQFAAGWFDKSECYVLAEKPSCPVRQDHYNF